MTREHQQLLIINLSLSYHQVKITHYWFYNLNKIEMITLLRFTMISIICLGAEALQGTIDHTIAFPINTTQATLLLPRI